MPVSTTIYASTVTWNSLTWNSGSGGPIQVRYTHSGQVVADRTGDDEYPRNIIVADKDCRVFVTLRDVKQVSALGAFSGSLVVTLDDGTTTSTITFATMLLYEVNGSQGRANPGEVELAFVHESSGGTAVPIT